VLLNYVSTLGLNMTIDHNTGAAEKGGARGAAAPVIKIMWGLSPS